MARADAAGSVAWPRNLLACLPILWSQVLFPARARAADPARLTALVLLLVLPAVLIYPCMSFYLFEPDEGRYAEIPREMLARGDWLVPYLQREPYLDKPPMLYWLVMASYSVFGAYDWSARLVPALAVHGTILITYLLGRRSLGGGPAFWGALSLALAPGFVGVGRLLIMDGPLTFFVALALFSAFEAVRAPKLRWHWWLLSAAACALAILTKGPVALILVLPPLWLHRRLTGNCCTISWRAGLVYAGVVLTIALPWFIAICVRLPEFGVHFFWEHNVVRFLFPFAHKQPVWFYVPIIFVGLLPVTALLVPFVRFLLTDKDEAVQRRTAELGFMMLAGGWCVLFFSLSTCKLSTYVLPAYPFLCLAFGAFIAGSAWRRARLTFIGCGASFAFMLAGHYFVVPQIAQQRSPMSNPGEVLAYCGDAKVPVVCYPRNVDSVAFYLRRDDLRSFRSKSTQELLDFLKTQEKTVVLFGHRHSLEQLQNLLPPKMRLVNPTKLGLCDMAVVVQARQEVLPMRQEIANLVHPVIEFALDLHERLQRDEAVNFAAEQAVLRELLLPSAASDFDADDEALSVVSAVRIPADYIGSDAAHQEEGKPGFLGILYALVCWLDELFLRETHGDDHWQPLEKILYGSEDRDRRFWRQAEIARTMPDCDALEVYYLCVMLGFRGKHATAPDKLASWLLQTGRSLNDTLPAWQPPAALDPVIHVPPLSGGKWLRRMLLGGGTLLFGLIPLAAFLAVRDLIR